MKTLYINLSLLAIMFCSWLHIADAQTVNIPDTGLEAAIRAQLGKEKGSITQADMRSLTTLFAHEQRIRDLTGLQHATHLKRLHLNGNSITDVTPLLKLTSLRFLDLTDNEIQNVHPLARLRNLRTLSLDSNPITINLPLTLTEPMVIKGGEFAVFSRDRGRSILGNVTTIYQDWSAFTGANPVLTKSLRSSSSDGGGGEGGTGDLLARVNETFDSFRTEGFGGTIELIAHPNTNTKFGDLVISEIMWGRHENMADNQWVELYSPKQDITLNRNRYALLLTGKYLERDVIPATEFYGGWSVIDRVRNATAEKNVSWELPGLSKGIQPDQPSVSMYREIQYATGEVPDGSLARSWKASSNRENLTFPNYGTPGAKDGTKVLRAASQLPLTYWVTALSGRLYRLAGAEVEMLTPNVQNITSLAVDAINAKVYFTEKTSDRTGKIHSVDFDGSNLTTLATIQSGVPVDLTIDPEGKRLYWTDSLGRVRRANLNGKHIRNLIQNLNSPKRIALHTADGKMYYTEANSIWRANLDGSTPEAVVTGLVKLGDIVIASGKMYWKQEIAAGRGAVKRADLDGSDIEAVVSIQGIPFGIAIDSEDDKLYWTNSLGSIQRANLDGLRIQKIVTGLDPSEDFALATGSLTTLAAPRNGSLGSTTSEVTQLLANYPNPFNPETWMPYDLAQDTDVHIYIYNLKGESIRELSLGFQTAGTYRTPSRAAYWDGRNTLGEPVASGVYFYTLQAGAVKVTRRMVILK
ncbi:MAG: leucine-rich repeat domain-containing protein [Candidatus Poribacteria bacterium]|nr:leucine-rich repeat domain-containing protein [Candidatus Poribacteria bacterium]